MPQSYPDECYVHITGHLSEVYDEPEEPEPEQIEIDTTPAEPRWAKIILMLC